MRILVLDDDLHRIDSLRLGLAGGDHVVVAECGPRDDLKTLIREHQVDIILASLSSPDRDVLEALRASNEEAPKPIAMFVDEPGSSMAAEAIHAGVSAYVVDGLEPKRVEPVLQVAIARFNEFQKLRDDLRRTQGQLAERKLIERAKGVLMQRQNLDEPEAYALLRKTAMHQGQKIAEIARSILSVSDLLGDGKNRS